jgi:hypothetical protein
MTGRSIDMAYICSDFIHLIGKKVGTGQCVALVQAASRIGNTGSWTAGIKVLTAGQGEISKGTVIATMVDGHYPNHAHGNHAAIYLSHDAHSIQVVDQWLGQPAHYRTIHDHGDSGSPSNDASKFYVVE